MHHIGPVLYKGSLTASPLKQTLSSDAQQRAIHSPSMRGLTWACSFPAYLPSERTPDVQCTKDVSRRQRRINAKPNSQAMEERDEH